MPATNAWPAGTARIAQVGGVIALVRNDVTPIISVLKLSPTIECIWLLLHADVAPVVIGLLYRPPDAGPDCLETLELEFMPQCGLVAPYCEK